MIHRGEQVPDFRLPSVGSEPVDRRRLWTALATGPVLLVFCPRDEIGEDRVLRGPLAYVPWLQFEDHVDVWVLTDGAVDGPAPHGLGDVTVLADASGHVADTYGVEYRPAADSSRTGADIVLVGPNGTARFVHHRGDPFDRDRLAEVRRALARAASVVPGGRAA